jgi:hypothetical protein
MPQHRKDSNLLHFGVRSCCDSFEAEEIPFRALSAILSSSSCSCLSTVFLFDTKISRALRRDWIFSSKLASCSFWVVYNKRFPSACIQSSQSIEMDRKYLLYVLFCLQFCSIERATDCDCHCSGGVKIHPQPPVGCTHWLLHVELHMTNSNSKFLLAASASKLVSLVKLRPERINCASPYRLPLHFVARCRVIAAWDWDR